MKKVKRQDQIIIRKKIEGFLTTVEEEQFNKLMGTSEEARSYYQKEAILHHSLEYDSSQIPEVDISDPIMQSVNSLNIRRQSPGKVRIIKPVSRILLLSYAAILLIGLIMGSMATYLGTTNVKMPDVKEVSGTLARPAGDGYSFNQAGTGIKVSNFTSGEFRMLIVEIETADSILCTIRDEQKTELSPNIMLLFSDGNFRQTNQQGNEESYQCSGKNVFLINNVDPLKTGSIIFTREDKLIYEFALTTRL